MPDPVTPSILGTKDDPVLGLLTGAIIGQESSGNYGAIGAPTKYGRAIGKYQILPGNIPKWSKDVLGSEVTPRDFLHSPSMQDAVAQGKIAQFYNENLSISDSPIEAAQRTALQWYTGHTDPADTPAWNMKQGAAPSAKGYVTDITRKIIGGATNPQNALRGALAAKRTVASSNIKISDLPYPIPQSQDQVEANRQAYQILSVQGIPTPDQSSQQPPDESTGQDNVNPQSDLMLNQQMSDLPSNKVDTPAPFIPNTFTIPFKRNTGIQDAIGVVPQKDQVDAVKRMQDEAVYKMGQFTTEAPGGTGTEQEAQYQNEYANAPQRIKDNHTEAEYIDVRKRMDAQQRLSKEGMIGKVLSTLVSPYNSPSTDVAIKSTISATNSFLGNAIQALNPEAYEEAQKAIDLGGIGNVVAEVGGGLVGLMAGLKGVGKLTEMAAAPLVAKLGEGAKLTLNTFGESGIGKAIATGAEAMIQQSPGQAIQVAQGKKTPLQAIKESLVTGAQFGAIAPINEAANAISEATGAPATALRVGAQVANMAGGEALLTGNVSPANILFGIGAGIGGGSPELPRSAEAAPETTVEPNVEAQQAQPVAPATGNEAQASPAVVSQAHAQPKVFDVVKPEEVGSAGEATHIAKIPVEITIPRGGESKGETEAGIPTTRTRMEDVGVIHRIGSDGTSDQVTAIIDGEKEANPHIVEIRNDDGSFKENVVVLKAQDAADAEQMVSNEFKTDNIKASPISKTDLRAWLKSDGVDKPFISENEQVSASDQSGENSSNVATGDTPIPAEESVPAQSNAETVSASTEPSEAIPEVRASETEGANESNQAQTIKEENTNAVTERGIQQNREPEHQDRGQTVRENGSDREQLPPTDSGESASGRGSDSGEPEGQKPEEVTGIRQSAIDANREARDLLPIEKEPSTPHEVANAEADRRISKNPNIGKEIISEVADHPRQLENWEKIAVARERVVRDKAFDDALKAVHDATTDEQRISAEKHFETAQKEKDVADAVQYQAGSASGSGLEFQKTFINNEDYSLAKLVSVQTEAQNHGKSISERASLAPEKLAQLEEQAKTIADLQAQIKEHKNKTTDAESASAYAQLIKDISKNGTKKPTRTGAKLVSFAEARETKARARLAELDKEMGGVARAQFLPDPRRLAAWADIGFAHIARGTSAFVNWSKAMIDDIGEHIRPHLEQIFEKSKENLARSVYGGSGEFDDTQAGVLANAKSEGIFTQKTIAGLMRGIAAHGVTDFDEAIKASHEVLQTILPDLTEREVRDKFSDYGKTRYPSRDAISRQVAEWRSISRLTSGIEDASAGKDVPKSGAQRLPQTEKVRQMTKELHQLLQRNGVNVKSNEELLSTNLKRFKNTAKNKIAELEEKLKTGDYSKTPRSKTVLDKEGVELAAKLQKVKDKVNVAVEMERLANRPSYEKFLDFVSKWRRFSVLTYPATFGKLLVAAWHNAAMVPIDEAQSGILHVILPRLESRASAEQFAIGSVRAYGQGIAEGLRGAKEKLFNRRSDLETVSEREHTPSSWMDYPSSLHGMVKEPVKEGANARAEYKLNKFANESDTQQAQKMRESLTREADIKSRAYKEAKRSILMQDNFATALWRGWMKQAENSKEHPVAGKMLATAMNIAIPVVKIPTNLAMVTGEHLLGVPVGLARYARWEKIGIGNMPTEVADDIMRNLKRGSIGTVAAYLAYQNPENVGGFYQPGQRSDSDIKALGFRFFGVNLPPWFSHTPLALAAQFGATLRRVSDGYVANGTYDQKKAHGLAWGAIASTIGVSENMPMVDMISRVGTALHDPNGLSRYLGGVSEGILAPGLIQTAAQVTDKLKTPNPNVFGLNNPVLDQIAGEKVSRKIGAFPTGAFEQVKLGFPVLRETVPTDEERQLLKPSRQSRSKSGHYELPR